MNRKRIKLMETHPVNNRTRYIVATSILRPSTKAQDAQDEVDGRPQNYLLTLSLSKGEATVTCLFAENPLCAIYEGGPSSNPT